MYIAILKDLREKAIGEKLGKGKNLWISNKLKKELT